MATDKLEVQELSVACKHATLMACLFSIPLGISQFWSPVEKRTVLFGILSDKVHDFPNLLLLVTCYFVSDLAGYSFMEPCLWGIIIRTVFGFNKYIYMLFISVVWKLQWIALGSVFTRREWQTGEEYRESWVCKVAPLQNRLHWTSSSTWFCFQDSFLQIESGTNI